MTPEPATSGSLLFLPMTAMLTTEGVTPFRSGARLGTWPSGPMIGTPATAGAASAATTAKTSANQRGDAVMRVPPAAFAGIVGASRYDSGNPEFATHSDRLLRDRYVNARHRADAPIQNGHDLC